MHEKTHNLLQYSLNKTAVLVLCNIVNVPKSNIKFTFPLLHGIFHYYGLLWKEIIPRFCQDLHMQTVRNAFESLSSSELRTAWNGREKEDLALWECFWIVIRLICKTCSMRFQKKNIYTCSIPLSKTICFLDNCIILCNIFVLRSFAKCKAGLSLIWLSARVRVILLKWNF